MLRMTPAKFKKLRPKYRVALVGALFANLALSVVCVYLFGRWLAGTLGIPPNVPARDQPNGATWVVLTMSLFVALQVVGGAAFLAFLTWCWAKFLRWPREQARRVFFHSEFPEDWFKP
jgi:hypothetical protein